MMTQLFMFLSILTQVSWTRGSEPKWSVTNFWPVGKNFTAFKEAEKKYYEPHVIEQRRKSDTKSRPMVREMNLFSRRIHRLLRITEKDLDCLGNLVDPYAILKAESDNFGRIRLFSGVLDLLLCFNSDGRLYTVPRDPAHVRSERCMFYDVTNDNHAEFHSVYNTSWTLACNRQGKLRNGFHLGSKKPARQFMQRPLRFSVSTLVPNGKFLPSLELVKQQLERAQHHYQEMLDRLRERDLKTVHRSALHNGDVSKEDNADTTSSD